MTTFNQEGQNVINQYNAGGDINFASGQNAQDLVAVLEQLKRQLAQASKDGIINEETSTDAEYQLTKALQQAKKPQPDKKTILNYLNTAKELVEGIATTGGLVAALVNITELVRRIF